MSVWVRSCAISLVAFGLFNDCTYAQSQRGSLGPRGVESLEPEPIEPQPLRSNQSSPQNSVPDTTRALEDQLQRQLDSFDNQSNRTPAALAGQTGNTDSAPESFPIRLARAPKMMGDLLGAGGTTVTMQAPSMTVSYTDFSSSTTFEGLGDGFDIGRNKLRFVPGDLGEFVPSSVFGAQVDGVAFRTLDTITNLNLSPNSPVALEIVGQNGSGTSDLDAQTQVQDNADDVVDSSFYTDKFSQQASIQSTYGPGSFSSLGGSDTITVDQAEASTTESSIDETTNFDLAVEYTVEYADEQFTPDPVTMIIPTPCSGDIIGRVRLQDNNSPIPQNRFFFDYNYFHNVPYTSSGVDVNRFTPALERTFWDDMASFEIRVPMGITLSSSLTSDLPPDVSHSEFGNIALATKFLLLATNECAVAAGCGVALPTADDFDVGMSDGTDLLSIQNDSVHVLPYLAFLYMPEFRSCFFQSFLTLDFDTNGSPVYGNVSGSGLEHIGRWNDQHLASLSVSAGTWVYENDYRNSALSRVALTSEIHYTETLNDADSVVAEGYIVGDPTYNLSLINATFGTHIVSYDTTFTFGYTVPLTDSDRVFDGEFRFMLNRPF